MTTGRTKAEFKRGDEVICFGTLPPARIKGVDAEGYYCGLKIRFRRDDNALPDKDGRTLVSRILFDENDVEAVKKMTGFLSATTP